MRAQAPPPLTPPPPPSTTYQQKKEKNSLFGLSTDRWNFRPGNVGTLLGVAEDQDCTFAVPIIAIEYRADHETLSRLFNFDKNLLKSTFWSLVKIFENGCCDLKIIFIAFANCINVPQPNSPLSQQRINFLLSSSTDETSPRQRRYIAWCGGRPYNPRLFICCGNRISRRPRGSLACCETRPYNTRWQICCGGNRIWRKPAGAPACCGRQAYNAQWYKCCGGAISRKPSGIPACCGRQAYNTLRNLCCNGKLGPRPTDFFACCGTVAYDGRAYNCCQGKVKPSCWEVKPSISERTLMETF